MAGRPAEAAARSASFGDDCRQGGAATAFSGPGVAGKSFRAADGIEHYLAIGAPPGLAFADQLAAVEERYAEALRALGLAPETAVFRRVFVSDAINQAPAVRASSLCTAPEGSPAALSVVRQPPLCGAKLALLAYHIDAVTPIAKRPLSPRHLLIEKNGRRHLWSTGLCAGADGAAGSPAAQTRQVFADLVDELAVEGGTLRDHCVRTWIYLKDVDVFYQGMVESRARLFQRHGLTRDTHYIASTGIEGACAHRHDLVALDAYSILDLAPGQVSYLNDFDRLCATADYNVTFERGTRIAYADRAHLFISGTASIDHKGRVLHPGDVLRQLERALGNVEALLGAGGAALADMMHLTVYLRDPGDFPRVAAYLDERTPALPRLVVEGAVCRPEWLVEVEGIAITGNDAPSLPRF